MSAFKKSLIPAFALLILSAPTSKASPPEPFAEASFIPIVTPAAKTTESALGWQPIPPTADPIVPVTNSDSTTATVPRPHVASHGLFGRLRRPAPAYPPNCPPTMLPGTQNELKKSDDPKLPFDPKAADQAPNLFAGTTEAGTQPGAMFNANMFGDRFGGNSQTITSQTIQTLTGVVQDQLGNAPYSAPFTTPPTSSVQTFSPTGPKMGTRAAVLPLTVFGATLPGSQNFVSSNALVNNRSTFAIPVALNENTTVTQTLAQSVPAGDSVVFRSGNAIDSGPGVVNIQQTYDFIHTTVMVINTGTNEVVLIKLPLPSSGGVVGFTKLSDNNSPMPRDRVIFDYDFSSNVPLAARGFDVHRFSPGFEKSFFDGWASFQLRVPFAATINSTSFIDGTTNRDTEFGDVNITLKALFYRRQTLNLSAGLGIALPTASDTRVRYLDGTDFVRIKNQSYILTPFIAGLWTPNDRFFAQAWAQVSFDAAGSGVFVNPDLNGLVNAGRIYDQKLMQLDAQIGYWLVRDSSGRDFLSGLAPFVELHYNTPLNSAQTVQSGGFAISSSINRYAELNISTGLNFLFNNRLNVITGLVVPLGGSGNKFFDYQIGVRANWLFGPNTRQSAVSNF